jgi:hypothetical protein
MAVPRNSTRDRFPHDKSGRDLPATIVHHEIEQYSARPARWRFGREINRAVAGLKWDGRILHRFCSERQCFLTVDSIQSVKHTARVAVGGGVIDSNTKLGTAASFSGGAADGDVHGNFPRIVVIECQRDATALVVGDRSGPRGCDQAVLVHIREGAVVASPGVPVVFADQRARNPSIAAL